MRQIFSQALYDLPIPKGLSDEEKDIYITQIEERAIPIEDDAVLRFETAYQKAKEFRVSNKWTRKILSSLNKYKPTEYPAFKDEKRLEVRNILTTSQFILPKAAQKLKRDQENRDADSPKEKKIDPKDNDNTLDQDTSIEVSEEGDSPPQTSIGQKKVKIPSNTPEKQTSEGEKAQKKSKTEGSTSEEVIKDTTKQKDKSAEKSDVESVDVTEIEEIPLDEINEGDPQ